MSLPTAPASVSPAPAEGAPAYCPPFADEARPDQPWVTTVERSQVRKFWKSMGWILAACMGVALLFAPAPWRDPATYGVSLLYSFSYCVGLWLANGYTVDWLNIKVGWDERPLRRLLYTVGASSLASMLVILAVPELYSMLLWHHPPGYALTHGALQQGIFPLLVTVVVSLFLHSRSFLLAWREATVRAERLEKESAVARLDSLRRQVDPHFLFNSLNALTSLVEEEPTQAVRFIRQLSQVYRYVLDSQEQELVPLADELAFAEAYVFLQQTRLGDALQVTMPATAATESNAAATESNAATTKSNSAAVKSNSAAVKSNSSATESNSAAVKSNTTATERNSAAVKSNSAATESNSAAVKSNTVATESNSAAAESSSPAAGSLYLPPLALQLLLENALKHNAAYQRDPLHLTVTLDVAAATLTVRNTLRPRRLAPGEVSGRGLANLRARYAFLTGRPLVAGPVAGEFVVTLPLLTV